jgi:hypothetical protein
MATSGDHELAVDTDKHPALLDLLLTALASQSGFLAVTTSYTIQVPLLSNCS